MISEVQSKLSWFWYIYHFAILKIKNVLIWIYLPFAILVWVAAFGSNVASGLDQAYTQTAHTDA